MQGFDDGVGRYERVVEIFYDDGFGLNRFKER
jgi:hypothetical protein